VVEVWLVQAWMIQVLFDFAYCRNKRERMLAHDVDDGDAAAVVVAVVQCSVDRRGMVVDVREGFVVAWISCSLCLD